MGKKGKYKPIKKVEYVVQDCPILGKKVVTHILTLPRNEHRPIQIR